MNSKLFETYLPEYMWRRKFGGPIAFGNIIKHIAEQYPVLCNIRKFLVVMVTLL